MNRTCGLFKPPENKYSDSPMSTNNRLILNKKTMHKLKKCVRILCVRLPIMFYHLKGHIQLARVLHSSHTVGLVKRHPNLIYKYLGGNYLAKCFSTKDRLTVLINHYRYLQNYVATDFLSTIYEKRIVLWQEIRNEHTFSITLTFPHSLHHAGRTVDYEGDLSLVFEIDAAPAYVFCFTIAPEHIASMDKSEITENCALFIGRIQGIGGNFDLIKRATKLLNDISPKDLLLSATQAVAQSLDIHKLVGIDANNQLSNDDDEEESEDKSFFFDYDKFWMSLNAEKTENGLFTLPIPIPEKPIAMIAQNHRARTLRKRKFKEELTRKVRQELLELYAEKQTIKHLEHKMKPAFQI